MSTVQDAHLDCGQGVTLHATKPDNHRAPTVPGASTAAAAANAAAGTVVAAAAAKWKDQVRFRGKGSRKRYLDEGSASRV
jgi:hypothetical protein